MGEEEEPVATGEPALSADDIAERSFPTAFRGFDPVEVRAFLARVADELRAAHAVVDQLREVAPVSLDDAGAAARAEVERVAAAAREEAESYLSAARERAAAIEQGANEAAAKVVAEARDEAARVVVAAERRVAGASEEAESVADAIRTRADKEAAAIRVRAREDADGILEAARQRGREMVSEAQAARERMLADLAKRKRSAQAQLDQLRVGRDRLLDALKSARRSIDEVTLRFEGTGESPSRPESIAQIPPSAQSRPTGPGRGQRAAEAQPIDASSSVAEAAAPDVAEPASATSNPHAAAALPREERRSSALRILRRGRPAPVEESPARPGLRPPDPVETGEGVRIIGRPAPSAAPPPSPPAEHEPESRSTQLEPAPEPEAEHEPEPEVPVMAEDLLPEDLPLEPSEELRDAPRGEEHEPDAVDLVERDVDVAPSRGSVDDLFARLRADRAEAVASANAVLTEARPTGHRSTDVQPEPTVTVSDQHESLLQRRDASLDPLEVQLVRRLKRAVQDDQNAALDRLRTYRGAPSVDVLLLGEDELRQRYAEIAAGLLEDAAREGATSSPFGAAPVAVGDLASQLASEVSDGLRSRVERALGGDDADPASLGERISGAFRDWKSQKADGTGAHFVLAAYARGAFVATAEGTALQWVVDDDGRCPDCDDNALAGPTRRGEPFPTGQLHPPAHVGCRCLLAPA